MTDLKIIGVEEHRWTPALCDRMASVPLEVQGVSYLDALIHDLTRSAIGA